MFETTNPSQSTRWPSRHAREMPRLWPDESHRVIRSSSPLQYRRLSPFEGEHCGNLTVATNSGMVCLHLKCKRVLRSGPANRVLCFAIFPAATWPSKRRGPMGCRKRGKWQQAVAARLFRACLETGAFALQSQPSGPDRELCQKGCRLPHLGRSSQRKSRAWRQALEMSSAIGRSQFSARVAQSRARPTFARQSEKLFLPCRRGRPQIRWARGKRNQTPDWESGRLIPSCHREAKCPGRALQRARTPAPDF